MSPRLERLRHDAGHSETSAQAPKPSLKRRPNHGDLPNALRLNAATTSLPSPPQRAEAQSAAERQQTDQSSERDRARGAGQLLLLLRP